MLIGHLHKKNTNFVELFFKNAHPLIYQLFYEIENHS